MARQGGESYIWFIALLSAAVGIVNLFPVPVLDGGHLVFFAYEAIVGRPPASQLLNALMMAGLTLVVSFMFFALANDILC
jgi:regulator of sigma E protease